MQHPMSVSWKEIIGVTASVALGAAAVIGSAQAVFGFALDVGIIVSGAAALAGLVFVLAVLGEIELRGLSSWADWVMLGLAEFVAGFGGMLVVLSVRARLMGTPGGVVAGPAFLMEAWWPALLGGVAWTALRLVMVTDRLRSF